MIGLLISLFFFAILFLVGGLIGVILSNGATIFYLAAVVGIILALIVTVLSMTKL